MAMPATLLMAKGEGDCERLKDMFNKEDAMAVVLMMASGNQTSTEGPTPAPTLNPVLQALACCGDSKGLNYLLCREEAPAPQSPTGQNKRILEDLAVYASRDRRMATEPAPGDVEQGVGPSALSASSLLEGVTVDGDTTLHAVATCGDSENFLTSAEIVYRKAKYLLSAQNKNGDTPVHCAARAEKSKMVSRLIELAKREGDSVKQTLLEMENKLRETVLHEAVRIGNEKMVEQLMNEDPKLSCIPENGTSPLYLAILFENEPIVDKLYEKSRILPSSRPEESRAILSYSGPNGQNALHAAALRGPVLTEKLLKWQRSLSTQKDVKGSTPLHFAAALKHEGQRGSLYSQVRQALHQWRNGTRPGTPLYPVTSLPCQSHRRNVCSQLLEANPAAVYEPDYHGLFPIHVAASVGATGNVAMFLKKYPGSAGLRDANGKTFLHVAVEKGKIGIVDSASRDISLSWIWDMRDYDGNTALHLAVQGGSLRIFCALFGNQQIQLNLINEKGETPLDTSRYKIPLGLFYTQNSEAHIRRALIMVGARSGASRQDHFEENYQNIHDLIPEDGSKELKNVKDTTQNLSIGSVLIATVTFGATFALPGGYRADDHTNGGAPTLAGRYAFDAFMMANTLAFVCSAIATIGFMFSGTHMVNIPSRKFHLLSSIYFMAASVTSLTAAFALGAYMVLAPVAHKTAVAVCVVIPFVLLWKNVDFWKRWGLLVQPLYARQGLCWILKQFTWLIVSNALYEFWPFVIIFCWATFARIHLNH